jgi:hypothetical protein
MQAGRGGRQTFDLSATVDSSNSQQSPSLVRRAITARGPCARVELKPVSWPAWRRRGSRLSHAFCFSCRAPGPRPVSSCPRAALHARLPPAGTGRTYCHIVPSETQLAMKTYRNGRKNLISTSVSIFFFSGNRIGFGKYGFENGIGICGHTETNKYGWRAGKLN